MPRKQFRLVIAGIVFALLWLIFWSAGPHGNDRLVCGETVECAYDDVSELNEIIKQGFDESLTEGGRQHQDGRLEGSLSKEENERRKPTLDAPLPPDTVIVAGSEASMPDKKDEPKKYVGSVIDPDKGFLVAVEGEPNLDTGAKKYDDAEWHYDGDFPRWTPIRNAFSHIGFYLTWAVENNLISDFVKTESRKVVDATLERQSSPIALLEFWDGKLVSDMLTEDGNAFSAFYYENSYFSDYLSEFSDRKSYKVNPSWKNYDQIKPVIDRRYKEWLDASE